MFLKQTSKLTSIFKNLIPQAHHTRSLCFHNAVEARDTGQKDSEAQKDSIKGSHILTVLNTFSQSSLKDEQVRDSIEKFIPVLVKNKNKLSGQQAVDVIKMLDQLGFARDSTIYSAMLQHVLECINDLSLKNFCEILDITHDRTVDEFLGFNLRIVLRERFLKRLSTVFDENQFESFQYAFQFIGRTPQFRKNPLLSQKLMKKLYHSIDMIPLDVAIPIYSSLHGLTYSQMREDTLQKFQDCLINHAHLLTLPQISEALDTMAVNEKYDSGNIMNEELADALVRRMIDIRVNVKSALVLLSTLRKARYKSEELLEYCCAAVFRAPVDPQTKIILVEGLLRELAMTRYKSIFWDEMPQYIPGIIEYFRGNPSQLVYWASNLAILGWLPNPMLEIIFDGSLKPSDLNNIAIRVFTTLYQRVIIIPSYNGPIPTNSQVSDLKLMLRKNHIAKKSRPLPFLPHLQEGMGDPSCIQTDVKTRFFYELDYVVGFYENGTPAPISWNPSASKESDNMKYIEDMTVPSGAKLVIIQYLAESWFFRNTNELMGDKQIVIESLELLPYPVVFVKNATWFRIPEHKRTSYIMEEIRAKLHSLR